MTRRLASLSCALLIGVSATAAGAQDIPKRPKLDAQADTNDWESYYEYGARQLRRLPRSSFDAFYWAARLAPWSADPLYAQWVAFHMRDLKRFERYLDDDEKVRTAADVQRSDSLVRLAFLRNPFVHRAMEMALFDAMGGIWGGDVLTRGWLAYANQKLDKATELFGRAIADKPDKRYRLRHIRAVLFVSLKQYDSALTEINALLEKTRQLDQKDMVRVYESKAFYEFATGRLELARGDRKAAREAFERALVEDLAYGPAHIWLAALSEASGDTASAMASYAQAVELAPADPIYRYQYAVALMKLNRFQEGLDQINRAISIEPYYADSFVFKASAHERLGQPDSARVAYRNYLDRASRSAQNRAHATRRLEALETTAPNR